MAYVPRISSYGADGDHAGETPSALTAVERDAEQHRLQPPQRPPRQPAGIAQTQISGAISSRPSRRRPTRPPRTPASSRRAARARAQRPRTPKVALMSVLPSAAHHDQQQHVPEPLPAAASNANRRSRVAPTTASSVFPAAMIAAPQIGMPVVSVDGERRQRDGRPQPRPAQDQRRRGRSRSAARPSSRCQPAHRTTARSAPSPRRRRTRRRIQGPRRTRRRIAIAARYYRVRDTVARPQHGAATSVTVALLTCSWGPRCTRRR